MFVAAGHFCLGQIFLGKVRSLPLAWIVIQVSTPSLAGKNYTIVKVTGSEKHSNTLTYYYTVYTAVLTGLRGSNRQGYPSPLVSFAANKLDGIF